MARRPPEWAAALALAVTAGAWAAGAARPLMPPFVPLGDYAGYGGASARAAVLVEPVAHAPWLGAASAPVAAAIAAAVLLCLWMTSRRAGASMAAAAVAAMAWAARPDIAAPWTLGAGTIVVVALLWASALAAAPAPAAVSPAVGHAPTMRALVAALCAVAAFALWPPLVVLAPVLVAAGTASARRLGAALAAASVGGAAAGLQLWAWRASALAGEPVSWLDAWQVASEIGSRGIDPFPWPPLSAAPVPVALALVGAVVTLQGAAHRGWWLAGALASAAVTVAPHPWHAEVTRAVYWSAWPLVGAGLTWFVAQAPRRARPAVLAAMALVAIGGGVAARVRPVETADAQAFAAALSSALSALTTTPATLVTEDTRVDTAVVSWDGGAALSRVRAVPALVAAAVERGDRVVAGSASRAVLELWGFRFHPGAAVTAPVPFELTAVRGRFRCVDVSARWNELAGLEYTGRLGVHLPRGDGRLEMVVSARAPLAVRASTAAGRPAGRLTSGPATSLSSLPPVLWPGDGRLPDPAAMAARYELAAHPDYDVDAALLLGARAPLVGARVVGDEGAERVATVCAAPLPRFDPFDAAGADAAALAMDDDAYFAGGWHSAEGAGPAAFRWTTGRAVALVPSSRSSAVALAIDLRPAARLADGPRRLQATVNGTPLDEQVLTDSTRTYTWQLPATIWVDGTNELVLEVSRTMRPSDAGSHDTRELGLLVSAVRLTRR